MALLTAEQIESVDDRKWEDVHVPEWGGEVRVLGLSGEDRDAYEAAMVDAKGQNATVRLANFRSKLVAKSLVGADFKPLFPDRKFKILAAKNGAVIDRLWDKTRELSGMTKESAAEGKGSSARDLSDAST